MTSSNASFIGTLRDSPNESAPSARIHFAFGSMPTSSSSVESSTPVHSPFDARPCRACAVTCIGSLENIGAEFPAHSMKCMRDTIG